MHLWRILFYLVTVATSATADMTMYYACPTVQNVEQARQNSQKSWNGPSPVMGPGGLVFQVQNTLQQSDSVRQVDFIQLVESFSTPFMPPSFTVMCTYKTNSGGTLVATGQIAQPSCDIDRSAGNRVSQKDLFMKQGMYSMSGKDNDARYCTNSQNCLVKCHAKMGFMGGPMPMAMHPMATHMMMASSMQLGHVLGGLIPH